MGAVYFSTESESFIEDIQEPVIGKNVIRSFCSAYI